MILVAANPYRGATRPRERVQALAAALAGVSCVVAAGGDGTTAAVINELAADVPLAVLPLGTRTCSPAHSRCPTIRSAWPA